MKETSCHMTLETKNPPKMAPNLFFVDHLLLNMQCTFENNLFSKLDCLGEN